MYGRALLLLPRVARPTDLLVVNFGLHHNSSDYAQHLVGFANYYHRHQRTLPRLLWQQTSQQHFQTPAGEYPGRHVVLVQPCSAGPGSCFAGLAKALA